MKGHMHPHSLAVLFFRREATVVFGDGFSGCKNQRKRMSLEVGLAAVRAGLLYS